MAHEFVPTRSETRSSTFHVADRPTCTTQVNVAMGFGQEGSVWVGTGYELFTQWQTPGIVSEARFHGRAADFSLVDDFCFSPDLIRNIFTDIAI